MKVVFDLIGLCNDLASALAILICGPFAGFLRTVRQLKGYHDSLLTVQNILLSFKIVEDIRSKDDRVKMVGKMLEFLMGGDSVGTGNRALFSEEE